jgi:hypothetical protein
VKSGVARGPALGAVAGRHGVGRRRAGRARDGPTAVRARVRLAQTATVVGAGLAHAHASLTRRNAGARAELGARWARSSAHGSITGGRSARGGRAGRARRAAGLNGGVARAGGSAGVKSGAAVEPALRAVAGGRAVRRRRRARRTARGPAVRDVVVPLADPGAKVASCRAGHDLATRSARATCTTHTARARRAAARAARATLSGHAPASAACAAATGAARACGAVDASPAGRAVEGGVRARVPRAAVRADRTGRVTPEREHRRHEPDGERASPPPALITPRSLDLVSHDAPFSFRSPVLFAATLVPIGRARNRRRTYHAAVSAR